MWAYAMFQPAAREESPQRGARAQITTAAKMEALPTWSSPWVPAHLEGDTGQGIGIG